MDTWFALYNHNARAMSPTKRTRFLLDEGEANEEDPMGVDGPLRVPPKRLRGGGGPVNPYGKSNKKSSTISSRNVGGDRPPPAPEDEDEEDIKPFFEDEEFMEEIQEPPEDFEANAAVSSTVFSDITENVRKRWLRPANQVADNSEDLSLQWLDMDLLAGKALEQNPNELLQNRRPLGAPTGQVPIIRAYGVTDAGNSVTVFIHGFTPYGYFALPPNAEFDDTKENRTKIVRELDRRLEGASRGGKLEEYCHRVEYVTDHKSIMGFETKNTKFLKITVAMPTHIPTLKRIMEDGIELPGVTSEGENQYPAFECNVPFVLRYMIDKDIAGAGWMTLPKRTYQLREASKMQTHTQVRRFERDDEMFDWTFGRFANLRCFVAAKD